MQNVPCKTITRRSASLTLAYIQHYNCKFIPGRYLTNTHLRRLAAWLGGPNAAPRTIRRHPGLAAHIALLQAAGLLCHNETFWYLDPDAYAWLKQPPASQYACLLEPIAACRFTAALETIGIPDALPLAAFIQQHLQRQSRQTPPPPETALWQSCAPDAWQLSLPAAFPVNTLFHLLQLGDWQPGQPLTLTPFTIAQAVRRGYSLPHVAALLQKATGAPLPPAQQQQLAAWRRQQDSYRLRCVTLLTTKQAQQLTQIIKNGSLRPHIQEQISPRQAIVSPAIQTPLQKWAARRGCLLHAPAPTTPATPATPTGYQWLGLQLLVALGQIIPLPCPPPHAELETLAPRIPPEEQTRLTALAEQIIASLQDAIRGRDAFFPARQPVPPEWLQTVQQAIQQETNLEIKYQPLGSRHPSWRRVTPLRLEQRGRLHYLHAYCHRAETNLTFRLDRFTVLKPLSPS